MITFVGRSDQNLKLELSSEAGQMLIWVTNAPVAMSELLLKSRVRIVGTCVGVHNDANGTVVSSLDPMPPANVAILQAAEETWQRYPLQAIDRITNASAAGSTNAKIFHLRGKIIATSTNTMFDDGSGRMAILMSPDDATTSAEEVEVLGLFMPGRAGPAFHCAVMRPVAPDNGPSTVLPTLTTIEQIHWLKPEEAARRYPVKVRGVTTWIQSGFRSGSVQDASGGVYVRNLVPRRGVLDCGMWCEIEGVTVPGRFAPGIECRKISVLGTGQYPEPLRPTWEEINSGTLDVQWVEVRGVVSAITNRFMSIVINGGRLACVTPQIDDVDRYLDAVVRVRGVIVYHADTSRSFHGEHLEISSEDFISIEVPPPDPATVPLVRRAADLMRYNPNGASFQRVKVIGQVVHMRDGILYLTDRTNGFRVVPANESLVPPPPGAVVEALGFPEIDDPKEPILTVREAAINVIDQKPLPEPQRISTAELLDPVHDSTLVRFESQLINLARYQDEQVFELQAGPRTIRARLAVDEAHSLRIPVGSRVDVAGVYVADRSPRLASGPFELLLNSPADIRILRRPSWWTGPHAAMVVGCLTLLLLLGLCWVAVLHQQVTKRTAQLSEVNQTLRREMTERHRAEDELVRTRAERLVEQERNRIARDLHDDLGSRVTRVVLMLDELALEERVPEKEGGEPVRKISTAARDIIHSLDENVWAVNACNDTLPHLIDYIGHFATDFLSAANVRCRMDFPDDPPEIPLSADVRHNLFLAVKEALTNAVRHAQASEIWIRAVVDDGKLTLSVEDNGRGFEARPNHPSADGLRNIRQRMESVGGRFDLESSLNNGTRVTLVYFCPPRK